MMKAHVLDITVNYKVADIIAILKTNKENHIREYEEAYAAYSTMLNKRFEKFAFRFSSNSIHTVEDVTDSIGDFMKDVIYKEYAEFSQIKKPENVSKLYDDYISIFEQSSSEEISLNMNDAKALVNDNWEWNASAKFINSSYASTSL